MSSISDVMAITNPERRKRKRSRAEILKQQDPKKYLADKMDEWSRKLVEIRILHMLTIKNYAEITPKTKREKLKLEKRLNNLRDKFNRVLRIMKKALTFFISKKPSVKYRTARKARAPVARLRVATKLKSRHEQDQKVWRDHYAVVQQLKEDIEAGRLDNGWSKPLPK